MAVGLILTGSSIKDFGKIWPFFDPPSPLCPVILAFHRQKLTVASAFDRPPLPLWCGRPLWMTPTYFDVSFEKKKLKIFRFGQVKCIDKDQNLLPLHNFVNCIMAHNSVIFPPVSEKQSIQILKKPIPIRREPTIIVLSDYLPLKLWRHIFAHIFGLDVTMTPKGLDSGTIKNRNFGSQGKPKSSFKKN